MPEEQPNEQISEFLETQRKEHELERLLFRAEAKAASFNLRPEAEGDLRDFFARKSRTESLNPDSLATYFAELRTAKPHWFIEPKPENNDGAKNGDTAREESKPERIDHKKSSKADFSAFLRGLGVRG